MEKRRVRLTINGVICGLLTEESDEYMQALAEEVGGLMSKITAASPYITREAAALTAALSFCEDAKQYEEKVRAMKQKVNEVEKKALEIERQSAQLKKENAQLWEETDVLLSQTEGFNAEEKRKLERRIAELEAEIGMPQGGGNNAEPDGEGQNPAPKNAKLRNPLKHNEFEQQGFQSFFEKKNEK